MAQINLFLHFVSNQDYFLEQCTWQSILICISLVIVYTKIHCKGFMISVVTDTLLFNITLTITLLEERF